jgi:MFS family permease
LGGDFVGRHSAPPSTDSFDGWVVVWSTCLAAFAVFGVAYSFGSLFTELSNEFGASRGMVAMFFALTTFIYFVLGVVTGRWADKYGPRPVLIAGAVSMTVGLVATSMVNSIWLGFITYGGGVGFGVACAYVPMVATVGGWFEKDRTKALGFATAGIGIGTLVAAPTSSWLANSYGWRTTYVVLGIVSGSALLIASRGAKRPPAVLAAGKPPPLGSLVKQRNFLALYASMMLMALPLFVPFVYMEDYLDARGSNKGPWIIGVIGAMSIIGRIGLGSLGSRLPVMRLYQGSFLTVGLSFIVWMNAGSSMPMLLAFAVILGIGYGGFIALSPAVTAQLFGPIGLGGVLGALYTSAGVGGLIGPPTMGIIIDRWGYGTVQTVCCVLGVSSVLVLSMVGAPKAEEVIDLSDEIRQSMITAGSGQPILAHAD